MKTHTHALVAALLLFGASSLCRAAIPPEDSNEFNGQPITEFVLRGSEGSTLDLKKFRGQPLLITFFASWCPPCRAELLQLTKLHEKYAERGLAPFALAVDPFVTPETAKDVRPLVVKLNLPYPVGLATKEIADDFHYKGFPATVLVDRQGKIAGIFFGYHDEDKLAPTIERLLQVPPK